MGDILIKLATDMQLGRLENMWDDRDFLVRGEDDLFQIASEKRTGTNE